VQLCIHRIDSSSFCLHPIHANAFNFVSAIDC
jgi:hypothetical protein